MIMCSAAQTVCNSWEQKTKLAEDRTKGDNSDFVMFALQLEKTSDG